eukprot:5159102-Amphidinium_carterae.1
MCIRDRCCATAKAGNCPSALQASEFASSSQIPCGQDGSTSQTGTGSYGEAGRASRGACYCLLGLGKVAGRV